MSATLKLTERLHAEDHFCIGLDPDPRLIPRAHGDVGVFLPREIILATAEFACAYKVNAAFLKRWEFRMICFERVRKLLPSDSYLVGCQAGDITNTNRHYAKSAFSVWNADAVTVSPYLGFDSLSPF